MASANDGPAANLRGLGPVGLGAALLILAILVFLGPPFAAVLVLGWAWASATPWSQIGYTLPRHWFAQAAAGTAIGIALKLLMKAAVMPLLGAPAVNTAFHFLAGNPAAAIRFAVVSIIIGAAWGEETVFRGWAFERLGKALGHGTPATTLIVVLASAAFALAHYADQGLPGLEQALVTGLVFGTLFAATGSLWMPFWAHAAFDLTAVVLIYFDLEEPLARLLHP